MLFAIINKWIAQTHQISYQFLVLLTKETQSLTILLDCFETEKNLLVTVKPVLSSHSKIDKTKVLKTNGSLMKVESIAE